MRFRPTMRHKIYNNNGQLIRNTRISNTTFIDHPESLELGVNVYIGHHNFIEASQGIIIHEGCQLTSFITMTSHSSHLSLRIYGANYAGAEMKGYVKGKIEIGRYSFIGPHVTIMPDTHIGKGCIVSAYSYVKGEFPDFSIISGNPAKIIGDTRTLDEPLLKEHPSLKTNYDEWVN
ncbi:MAG: acyltransferase [Crocinitomicaceae bacterium]|nr:acyltransferase [Crocinitomicaceae bacterium]